MTVADLIKKLQALPHQDNEVLIGCEIANGNGHEPILLHERKDQTILSGASWEDTEVDSE